MNDIEQIVVIGSGCAGSTAAIYAARAGLFPVVINGGQPGGQLTTTSDIENFPGFQDGINGFDLTYRMRQQAEKFGARYIDDVVCSVDFSRGIKQVRCENTTFNCRAVIIATGASPKLLGVAGEQKFYGGRGVSVCATCDGAFYKNKDVVVIGGGDTACEEALFLTHFCSHVYLIHRRDQLRASPVMKGRVLSNDKITKVWNSVVDEIVGDDNVTGVYIRDVVTGNVAELSCSGVFVAIGHVPNTRPFINILNLDTEGYIIPRSGSFVNTDIDGVFVAGDCADRVYRQAITSAGTGAMAAISAERYLCEHAEVK